MKLALALLYPLVLTGCGWGYAQQVEKDVQRDRARAEAAQARATPTEPRQRVVARAPQAVAPGPPPTVSPVLSTARDLATLEHNHQATAGATTPSEMNAHVFTVRLVDPVNDAIQHIHCSSGKTVRFDRGKPSPAVLDAWRAAEKPMGVWIVEIDPSGQRTDLLNNDWYRHISKSYRLEFVERNRTTGTVIYRFLGPRRANAARRWRG